MKTQNKPAWRKFALLGVQTLALSLLASCGGGGGSSVPLSDTTLTGTVLSIGGLTAGRGASATTVRYSDLAAISTGTLQLVRVNNDGTLASVLKDNIPLGADGAFSVTVSPSVATVGSSTLVLSHSLGLKAVVSSATGLRVDPVGTWVFEKAQESGFSAVTLTSALAADTALRTAWQAAPVQTSSADGDVGNVTRLMGALGGLASQSSVSVGGSGFCSSGVKAFLVSSDYRAGALAAACLSGGSLSVRKNLVSIHQDAVVHYSGGVVYVLNRYRGDNLQVIDASTFRTTNQLSLKSATDDLPNPQDVEVISATKAFVSLYDKPQLLVVDPTKTTLAAATVATVDLTPFMTGDTDGKPEAGFLVRHGGRVMVGLQRLNQADGSFAPVSGSALVVVDENTNQVVDANSATAGTQAVELPGGNCTSAGLDNAAGVLYVSCTGKFFNPDFTAAPNTAADGVYAVNLSTFAVTQVVSNSTLGLKATGVVFGSAARSYAVLYDAVTFANTIKPINLTTGQVGETVYAGDSSGFEVDSAGNLWVGVRQTGQTGVKVFSNTGAALFSSPVSIGLAPSHLVIVP